MTSAYSNNIINHQYVAHKGEDILSQVHKINCILSEQEFVACGYHPSNEVLIVDSSSQKSEEKHPEFMEHCFLNVPLLAEPGMVKGIFVFTEKCLLIPQSFFKDEADAVQQLEKLFFIESSDTLAQVVLEQSQLVVCFAYPKAWKDLLEKYIAQPNVLPLQVSHIYQRPAENLCQCIIGQQEAIVSLQFGHRLMWQQNFSFETAEDIVYKIASACEQFSINPLDLQMQFSATGVEQHTYTKQVEAYFRNIQNHKPTLVDISSPEWSSTIRLFQQLNLCVS